MDLMLLGETIQSNTANRDHYGFWMAAGGNDGVAGVEVFHYFGSFGHTVSLQTKKSDEADGAAVSVGSASIGAAGIVKFNVTNAKDLVRYRIHFDLDEGASSLHVQICQPLWSPN